MSLVPPKNAWRFSAEEMRFPASVVHSNIRLEDERELRSKGSKFIANMGVALKLPAAVIATAQVFMHRFFQRESFKTHKYHDVCGAAVYLATKVEETGRRLRQVITIAAQKALKNDAHKVEENSKEFKNWWDTIMYYEELLLDVLCWEVNIDYPYEWILRLCKLFGESAWALANDSYRYPFCLQFSSQEIATACVVTAFLLAEGHDSDPSRIFVYCSTFGMSWERVMEVVEGLVGEVHEREVRMRLAIVGEKV
ncbi:hypothetical protein HDU79_003198 [Rhizoclosmatium sp. JEL0117]|nr:hypothetical protein HDU79_003198 [Rhizoclosmatium sp. JEL0117]